MSKTKLPLRDPRTGQFLAEKPKRPEVKSQHHQQHGKHKK